MTDLKAINNAVRETCLQVAGFIQHESEGFSADKIEHKGFNDLVSYVDKESEQMLVKACKKILPAAGFITEEGTETIRKEEFNWIIDPLDGTTNFTHGLPVFAISVALMRHDEIVAGVVHEVNRNECFHAIEGEPAYCNEQIIKVSGINSLENSLLATGFPYYNFDRMEKYLQILNAFMQQTHGLRRMGSAAVDLAYVACGRFEGFFEFNLNSWDVAAGALIVKQAGGTVTDFKGGGNYTFGREIIAGGPAQSQMVEVIQQHWYDQN